MSIKTILIILVVGLLLNEAAARRGKGEVGGLRLGGDVGVLVICIAGGLPDAG